MNNLYLYLLFSIFLLCSCVEKKSHSRDLNEIIQSGELTIITLSSSTSYFIYKDEPMGYDYDLAKDFCDFHKLKMNVKVAENPSRLLEMLENGEGDLVAYLVPIKNELKDSVIYCGLEQISHQVLVQKIEQKDSMILDVPQLIGKKVYVKGDTKYQQRLENLDNELGNGIIIKSVDDDSITVEDLIDMVANNSIKYTVTDEYIAKLNKTYHQNINISVPLSFEQRSSWVVRKDTPLLAKALNDWFSQNDQKPVYTAMKKYFELSKEMLDADDIDFLIFPKGDISSYDSLFKKYAKTSGYDWKLIAAITYKESHFKPEGSSWAGAVGLMGLMPRTAGLYGVEGDELKDPEQNIMAGSSYMKHLGKIFAKIPDPDQRIKFILASYNGGNGHIADARALAKKYGDNPDIWDGHVDKYIKLKSKPEYYNDSVVKCGYFRGTETINYVEEVTRVWEKFKSNTRN